MPEGPTMAKALGKVAGYMLWLAALLVAILLAGTFIPTVFGLDSSIVASGSMKPAMQVGSVALTREVDARSIAVGDIINFRRPGEGVTTTHRVVDRKVEAGQVVFTTKGDANASPDPNPVYVDRNINKVEYVVPAAGYVVRYARTPIGAVMLFLVPLAGLLFERQRQRRRGPRHTSYADLGWSATTLSLLRVAPDPIRGDPSG
jgi:signal peptidase I